MILASFEKSGKVGFRPLIKKRPASGSKRCFSGRFCQKHSIWVGVLVHFLRFFFNGFASTRLFPEWLLRQCKSHFSSGFWTSKTGMASAPPRTYRTNYGIYSKSRETGTRKHRFFRKWLLRQCKRVGKRAVFTENSTFRVLFGRKRVKMTV